MNAREVIEKVKSQMKIDADLKETDIQVDVIGNSRQAEAVISFWVEGKLRQIQIEAKELPWIE